jgi:hypothetical protein
MPRRAPIPHALLEALRDRLHETFANADAEELERAAGQAQTGHQPQRAPVPSTLLEALRDSLREMFADADAGELERIAGRMKRSPSQDFIVLRSSEWDDDVLVVAEIPWQRHTSCPLAPPISRSDAYISGLADLVDLFPEPRETFDRGAAPPVREHAAAAEHRRAEARSQRD